MNCKDCDFIKEDLERITEYYRKKGYNIEDYLDEIIRECYCDKVGGKIGLYGMCSDVDSENRIVRPIENVTEVTEKLKARRRRKNDRLHKRKLKWQAQHITSYPTPAFGVDRKGFYTDKEDEVVYYRETNKSKRTDCYSEWKKQTNKKVRKLPLMEGSLSRQKGLYKKVQKGYVD